MMYRHRTNIPKSQVDSQATSCLATIPVFQLNLKKIREMDISSTEVAIGIY